MSSRILYRLTILKKQYWDNGEKILGGHDHFLGEGVILRQKWI